MPVYCGVHLLVSPTALSDPSQLRNSIRPRDDLTLSTLPWSILCGYILPATMMSIPYTSPKCHQYLVALWQVYPVWIVTFQFLFHKAFRFFSIPQRLKIKTSCIGALDSEGMNHAYRFAFALAALTNCITLGLIFSVQWFPTPIAASNGHTITLKEVFVPSNFRIESQISDMVQGAHGFFQYDQYVGSSAIIIWAMTLRFNERNGFMSARHWVQLAFEIFGYILVAGPTGALVMLLWTRDIQAMDSKAHMN